MLFVLLDINVLKVRTLHLTCIRYVRHKGIDTSLICISELSQTVAEADFM